MVIGWIQEHLEDIYDRKSEMRAHDYVVDDAEKARRLGFRAEGEELLVGEYEDGGVGVALFFSKALLEEVSEQFRDGGNPLQTSLDGYCQLVEGVSHFLYLDRAQDEGRRVSRLELEAQAEIDKFASCVLCGWTEGEGWAAHILQRLFVQFRLREGMGPAAQWRYQEANRLALRYCNRLMRHVAARRRDRFLSDLRYSYRLGADAKLRHLSQNG